MIATAQGDAFQHPILVVAEPSPAKQFQPFVIALIRPISSRSYRPLSLKPSRPSLPQDFSLILQVSSAAKLLQQDAPVTPAPARRRFKRACSSPKHRPREPQRLCRKHIPPQLPSPLLTLHPKAAAALLAIGSTNCSPSDAACLCTGTAFQDALRAGIAASCGPADVEGICPSKFYPLHPQI